MQIQWLRSTVEFFATLPTLAKERSQSAAQLALAWVLAKQPRLVPLLGARTRAQLLDLPLSTGRSRVKKFKSSKAIVPAGAILGSRYPPEGMAELDSEVWESKWLQRQAR